MCRMIAATGSVDPPSLREALARMAANDNPRHSHERRARAADCRHEDGWGAAWVERNGLRVRHSIHSCLADPLFPDIDSLRTDLLVLHARRATQQGTVTLENTHPFLVEHQGRPWAFCHNGALNDFRAMRPASGLIRAGTIDSEVLFYHILNHIDANDLGGSVLRSLEPLEDYTALLCLLTNPEGILAVAKRHPDNPESEYYALWEGVGPNLHVVSSEPVEGLKVDRWTRVPDPGMVHLRRGTVTIPA